MKKYTWIKAALVRAVKTVAQTAVATIGTTALLHEVDWAIVGSASLLAGILSLLTSVAGLPEVKMSEGNGVPGKTQQSGLVGERTSAGMDEVSPAGGSE